MKKKILKFLVLANVLMLASISTACDNQQATSSSSSSSSSSSPSSSSVVKKYNVTCSSVAGANVTVDKMTAEKGEKVTISVNITDDTKIVEAVTVGNLTVTTVEENKTYTFIMGEENVNVVVSLVNKPKQAHSITINHDDGVESFTLKVNNEEITNAKEGEEVTLELTLKDKYMINEIKCTDLTLNAVDNSVTFTMLDKDLVIEVTTSYIQQKFKVNRFWHSSTFIDSISGLTEQEELLEGSEQTFSVCVKNYYANIVDFKFDLNGTEHDLTIDSEKTNENYTYFTGSFTMPVEDINVFVYPVHKKTTTGNGSKITLNYDSSMVTVYGFVDNEFALPIKASESQYSLYYYFSVIPKEGYKIDDVKKVTSYEGSVYVDNDLNMYSFYYSTSYSEITIKVTASASEGHNVTITQNDNVKVNHALTNIGAGTQVKINVEALNGYAIRGISSSSESSAKFDPATNSLYFVMPKNDVTITLNVAHPIKFNAIENPNVESFYFKESKYNGQVIEESFAGDTVYVYVTPKEGYEVNKIKLNGKEYTKGYNDYFSVTVVDNPSFVNVIEFVTIKYISITYTENEAYTINVSKSKALPNDFVSVTVLEKLGYRVTSVRLSTSTEPLKEDTYERGHYSFYAPSEDVEIVVEFMRVDTFTLEYSVPAGISNFKLKDKYNKDVNSLDTLNEGEELTMSFTVLNGYEVNSVSLNQTALELNSSDKYEFTMPKANSTITFDITELAKQPITFDYDETLLKVTEVKDITGNQTISLSDIQAYVGHKIRISFAPKNSFYYQMDTTLFNVKDLNGDAVEFTNYGYVGVEVVMPDKPIVISAGVKETEGYLVHQDQNSQDHLSITNTSSSLAICEGETFKICKFNKLKIYCNKDADFNANDYVLVITDGANNQLAEKKFWYENDYLEYQFDKQEDIYFTLTITAK